jgi:hypothetical protein
MESATLLGQILDGWEDARPNATAVSKVGEVRSLQHIAVDAGRERVRA